jgi:hypothetical protein
VGFGLIIVGAISSTTAVTIIGALVTAATVATIGLAGAHLGAEPSTQEQAPDSEDAPPRHLEGMNHRLTDTWEIWER